MRIFLSLIIFVLVTCAGAVEALSVQRTEIKAAFDAAESGQLALSQTTPYIRHPLFPWLQATVLRKRIDTVKFEDIQPVLDQLGDQAAGRWLRESWLTTLAKRKDWAQFRLAYRGSDDKTLRCADLAARLDVEKIDAEWQNKAVALWLTGTSLPDSCDTVFVKLAALGTLNSSLRWQRIELAAAEGQTGVMRHAAKGLPSEEATLASSYAAFIESPSAAPNSWPTTPRSRWIVAYALARLAKRDPGRAEDLLRRARHDYGLDEAQYGRVRYEIALWTVASYLPESAGRLNAVPESAYDERLHEWRVREAISRGDDAAALAAIRKMSSTQRNDSRWQYFEARLLERQGQNNTAAVALYRKAAVSPGFHGWLAADRLLQQPYVLCALEPVTDTVLRSRIASHDGISRALELFAIDRTSLAAREWSASIKRLSDDERRLAVQRALGAGWYDRAVFAMNISPNDTGYYSLRFPLHHENDIRVQSKANGLDPAWVAGQTRAESAFMPRARSGADARGLMQLLPGTGELTAQRLGKPWRGGESLYDPATNIMLGTAYLRQMLDRFDGLPYLAIAAYNAGPAPVQRWMQARGALEPDFFIESIPYKETREYVARVLAFSVVYDWRLNKDAVPLNQRMRGQWVENSQQRRVFNCPLANAGSRAVGES